MTGPIMIRPFLYPTVLAILLAMGLAQGVISDRWSTRVDWDATKAAMEAVPLHFGDWKGSNIQRDDAFQSALGPELMRRYVNRVDGITSVIVFLTAGPPGPIYAIHSPDSCYPGAGFTAANPPARYVFEVGQDRKKQEFLAVSYSKTRAAFTQHLQLYWGYSATGDWQAPKYGRLAFARYRRLFKIYVIHEVPSEQPLGDDPAVGFIKTFIPELNKALFQSS
jgi:hypothetical protein